MSTVLICRAASRADIPSLNALMKSAIGELQREFLPPEKIAASFDVMGLDSQLIDDGTYFIALQNGVFAGCGGWSRRATLFGGDHSAGRSAALLDPRKDAARVRAMYTSPAFVRRGVGRFILGQCEAAAAGAGFLRAELAATLAGEPLYLACGYRPIEKIEVTARSGLVIPMIRMGKALPAISE